MYFPTTGCGGSILRHIYANGSQTSRVSKRNSKTVTRLISWANIIRLVSCQSRCARRQLSKQHCFKGGAKAWGKRRTQTHTHIQALQRAHILTTRLDTIYFPLLLNLQLIYFRIEGHRSVNFLIFWSLGFLVIYLYYSYLFSIIYPTASLVALVYSFHRFRNRDTHYRLCSWT